MYNRASQGFSLTSTAIHTTAIVSPDADVDSTVTVGPGALIEADVAIGPNTEVGAYSIVRRYTTIGANNRIDAQVVIGGLPQHTAWDGAKSSVVIGDDNTIREFSTIHRGYAEGGQTRIGSNCLLMAYSHVGHDCIVGDNVILTNVAQLGGHVEVGDNAIMGGASGAHQFTRVGAFCMVAAHIVLKKDALPYSIIGGEPVRHYRLNRIGLKRNGIDGDRFRALESAFRALRGGDREFVDVETTPEIEYLRNWVGRKSKYGLYGFVDGNRSQDRS